MKPSQPLRRIVPVILAMAITLAFSSTSLWRDESSLDASNPFNRPLEALPDDMVVEAYRSMGWEASRSSQSTLCNLFLDHLHESDTPFFEYISVQVMRNAGLLGKASNNTSLERLYRTILKSKETMRRYENLTRRFRYVATWVYDKKRPSPRIEGMIKAEMAESDSLGLHPWEGTVIETLADYYFSRGDDELALRSLEKSLACHIEGENISAASHTAGRIGIYHLRKGNLGISEEFMFQSLHYAQLSADPYYLSRSLSFLAELRAAQGHFADAESLIAESIQYCKKTKNPRDEFIRITSLAALEVSFGEYSHAAALIDRAMLMADKSLSDALAVPYRNQIHYYLAQCLMLRATIQLADKEYGASIATMQRALETCRGTIDKGFEAELAKKLGDAYAGAGRDKEAMRSYEKALGSTRRLHTKNKETECLTAVGARYLREGEYRRAERALERAIEVEGTECWMQKIQTLDVLARAETALGEYLTARNLLEKSIAILEQELAAKRFVENRYALYMQLRENLADLIALSGEHFYDCDTLIAAAEKARQLRNGGKGIQRADLDACIRKCLTERDWIPEDALIIQYLIANDRVIIVAMDRHGGTYRVAPVSAGKLEAEIDAFIAACMAPESAKGSLEAVAANGAIREKARALYGWLLEPISPLLSCKETLCFIPDEALRRLPFGALIPPGAETRFLVEGKKIIGSPDLLSASSRRPHTRRSKRTFSSSLIIGRPEMSARIKTGYPSLAALPNTQSEIIEIGSLIDNCTILSGPRATKGAVIRELQKADHIHVATHRIPYRASSGESALLLSDSGGKNETLESSLITEDEIRKLDLSRARLVVLAACESAVGRNDARAQTFGLAGAFLDAGAQSVAATIWPIEDDEAGRFVAAFYREMICNKRDPLDALQIVQKRSIDANRSNSGSTLNIRSWGPYLLLGSL